jgi:hypothetical protein
VNANGFQFLGKYSQPQNILCIKYTYQIKKKVKFTPEQVMKTHLKWRDKALLSTLGARFGVGGQCHALEEKRPNTHCRGDGWPQGRSEQEGKISPPSGFQPRTTHHV